MAFKRHGGLPSVWSSVMSMGKSSGIRRKSISWQRNRCYQISCVCTALATIWGWPSSSLGRCVMHEPGWSTRAQSSSSTNAIQSLISNSSCRLVGPCLGCPNTLTFRERLSICVLINEFSSQKVATLLVSSSIIIGKRLCVLSRDEHCWSSIYAAITSKITAAKIQVVFHGRCVCTRVDG